MILDLEKCLRFGVDKLSIYNFKLTCHNELKAVEGNENYLKESIFIKEKELFNLKYTTTICKDSNDLKTKIYSRLTFNPNKLLYGHNIYNSKKSEIDYALDKLLDILKKRGIEIDLSTAKIREIEINKNFSIDFDEYIKAFEIIALQLPNSGYYGKYNREAYTVEDLKKDKTIFDSNDRRIFRLYDKSEEVKKKNNIDISNLVRFEFTFLKRLIYEYFKKKNLENSLYNLSDDFIEEMFIYYFELYISSKVNKHINIKSAKLEEEYLKFKRDQKQAKQFKRPVKYKVYEYLKKFIIYDKQQILDIVKIYNNKNYYREKEKIEIEFSDKDTFEKLSEFKPFFPQNFKNLRKF